MTDATERNGPARSQDLDDAPGLDEILAKAPRENFPVALRLLSPRVRRDLLSIYAFARLADDIGDEASGDRLAMLDALEAELDRAYSGEARHPVMRRLQETLARRSLPRAPFADLIEANRLDQRISKMETWDDLEAYCRLSANPVGRLVLAVFEADTPERIAASDAVCTALQVVEHCQDVREDYAKGRVYLPTEELRRLGADPASPGAQPHPPQLRRAITRQVERARELLGQAPGLVASLSGGARLAVAGFAAGGLAAADAIERAAFDTSAGPPRARRRDLLRHALRLLRGRTT